MSRRELAVELLTWASVAGVLVLVGMAALYVVFVGEARAVQPRACDDECRRRGR